MKRIITNDLINWKNNPRRRPLLLRGASQVGKTFSVMEFGVKHYCDIAYFPFQNGHDLCALFEQGFTNITTLIFQLEKFLGVTIAPEKTLMIFDDIHLCPQALSSLKQFSETAPNYHLIATSSVDGPVFKRTIKNPKQTYAELVKSYSFPVGCVDELTMYPLDFEEFLWEFKPDFIPLIKAGYLENQSLETVVHEESLRLFQQYLILGGMPSVLREYILTSNYTMAQIQQQKIISLYSTNMIEYAETKKDGLLKQEVYHSLESQLKTGNKKFQSNLIRSGVRGSTFNVARDWLTRTSIAIKCNKIKKGINPIGMYQDYLSLRYYFNDVGLLSAKYCTSSSSIKEGLLNESVEKVLTKNYVITQLITLGYQRFYWNSGNQTEEVIVFESDGVIVPLEIESSTPGCSRVLKEFMKKYHVLNGIKISREDFGIIDGIKSIPVYAVWCIRLFPNFA
jgi:predicted AAA+ superfamily ATPase